MPSSSEKSRVPTGIEGFDEFLSGGFIRESVNLLRGSPGSGKSIFGMQFLVNGIIHHNEPGVYITFEEGIQNLKRNMSNFGWNIDELEKKGMLGIIKLSPVEIEPSPFDLQKGEAGTFSIKNKIIKKIKAKRVVMDSVTAYSMLYKDDIARRKACFDLFEMLRQWGCTSLIIAEYDQEDRKDLTVDYLVDSIIWLSNLKKGDTRTRAIEILKMRGSKHSQRTSALEISDEGIKVHPEQTVY